MSFRSRIAVAALAASGMLVLLSGCTKVGPDFVKPDAPMAEQWTETGELQLTPSQTDHANWWESFNDSILDKLIDEAYAQNLPLQIAGLRILEARAQLGLAIGSAWPQQQQALLGATYSSPSDNTAGSAFLSSTWNYDTGVSIGWEIDFWGKFKRGIQSADASLLASIADYDDFLVSLTAEVANAYTLIRTFQEQLVIARANVEIQERSLKIADVRFRNGATTELDVQQARTLLLNTQATIPSLESSLRQAENALSILLGMPPGKVQDLLGEKRSIPSAPAKVAVGVPAELLRRRPDVRRAELQAAAQSAQIGVAEADLYPSFTLFGTIGLVTADGTSSARNGTVGFGDMFRGSAVQFMGGPSVTWNIFNYGRIKNNVRLQDARLQQSLVSYQNTVLQAAREAEDAMSRFLQAQRRIVYLAQSVTAASRSVELALLQYRDGTADYTRVLNTQQSLSVQQDQLTASRGDEARGLIGMYKALGGGWQIRAGDDFVPESTKEQMRARTDWGKLLDPAALENIPEPGAVEEEGMRRPDW